MSNLCDREKDAKLKAIENCLWGVKLLTTTDTRELAKLILSEIEQVEIDFDNEFFEARLANAN